MENLFLYNKIAFLPEHMKSELADFIDFLSLKAKVEHIELKKVKPKFGSGKGMFIMEPDFDEPLDDFKEYMY